MHQERFSEAATILDELINKQKDHIAAWVLRGHAYYFNDNLFDSEESYIKALRLNPQLDDSILQERLGIVYIKRKAWKDARTVFLKCCKETTRFVSWAYLGYCLLKLGELAQAEDAISQANIIDHSNPIAWGMMTLLCLTTGETRLIQANMSFIEAIKLGLKNQVIIEEVGDLYSILGQLDQALIAYEQLAVISPDYAEGLKKYASVLENPRCNNQSIDRAIDIYKKALHLIDGVLNKHEIAKRLE